MPSKILVTGGAGYIGSHTCVELLKDGHEIVIVDNLSNSNEESVRRLKKITGRKIAFYNLSVQDEPEMRNIFKQYAFDSIIHFAGLKSVGESIKKPVEYYNVNLTSTLVLIELAREYDVKKFVFSSSATVYGAPEELPLKETSRVGVGLTNPYGRTKYMLEEILKDVAIADPSLQITLLRYFNPVGAHESGLIGEDPGGTPNNILPYISQVAVGKLDYVNVFGDDYDTPDGTGVRDYIHVVDLAKGHLAALNHSVAGVSTYNLATGTGTSVLELIKAFGKSAGREIPYKVTDRRPGDVASCYASAALAKKELGWSAGLSIQDACDSTWKWQSQNPNGFKP